MHLIFLTPYEVSIITISILQIWKVRHREVKGTYPRKQQSWDLNTRGPWKTMGTGLWSTFRGDYDNTVKCCEILGDQCLLQNMSVDFPCNKATCWALCMEACKSKALLCGENTQVSSWELGDGIEKCIFYVLSYVYSHIRVSDTRSPVNTLCQPAL